MAYEFQQFLDSLLEARPTPDSPPRVDRQQFPEQHRSQIQNFIDDKMGFPANAIFFLNGLDRYIQTQKKPDAALINLRTRAHIAWMAEINDSAATVMEEKKPIPSRENLLNKILPSTGKPQIDKKLKAFFLLHLTGDMGSIDIAAMMVYRLIHEVAQNPSMPRKPQTPIRPVQNYYSALSERRMAMKDKIKALIIKQLSASTIKKLSTLENPLKDHKSNALTHAENLLKAHMNEKWVDAQQAVKHLKIYAQLKQHPDLFEFYLDLLLNPPHEPEDRRKMLKDSWQFILFWKEVAEMGLLTAAQEKTLHKIMTARKLLSEIATPLNNKDIRRIAGDKKLFTLFEEYLHTEKTRIQHNTAKIFPYLANSSAQEYISALLGVLLVDKHPVHASSELNQEFKNILQNIASSEKVNIQQLEALYKKFAKEDARFAKQVKTAKPEDFNARMAEWDLLRATMGIIKTLSIDENPALITIELQKALEDVVKTDKHHHEEILSIRTAKEMIWATIRSYNALKTPRNNPQSEESAQEQLHHPAPH